MDAEETDFPVKRFFSTFSSEECHKESDQLNAFNITEIISKQCPSGPNYNHQCIICPTLCTFIFK